MPSRASLFSGQYPFTTGAFLNGSDPWEKSVMDGIDSLPEQFKRGGCAVWSGGKIFHAKLTPACEKAAFDNKPYADGFGPFVKAEDQLAGKSWGTTAWDGPDSDFPDTRNTQEEIGFLNQSHEKPFCLMLGLWRPPHAFFSAAPVFCHV